MKNATLALLGGIIGSILYSFLGVFIIFLAVWVFGVITCFRLSAEDYLEPEEFCALLFFSTFLWFIFIPISCFEDRAGFCKFFHIPYFEFRSPIIIKETEE